jgi:DNA-binding transcriptional MerR regulator
MRLKPTYSSREVAALTGLTARQLQLWDAGGLMRPAVPTHRTTAGGFTERRYTPTEVLELLVLADLRSRGFSVHDLHAIVDALRARFTVSLFEATGGGRKVQLLTDGERVFARTAAGEFYNLLDRPAQPLLAVGDERMLKVVEGKVRRRKRHGARTRISGG